MFLETTFTIKAVVPTRIIISVYLCSNFVAHFVTREEFKDEMPYVRKLDINNFL
jgi:hypothetical protein